MMNNSISGQLADYDRADQVVNIWFDARASFGETS